MEKYIKSVNVTETLSITFQGKEFVEDLKNFAIKAFYLVGEMLKNTR